MDSYSVELLKTAEDDLDNLKHKRDEAVEKLRELEENPKEKSSALSGHDLPSLYCYSFNLKGSGSYRAIFDLIEENKVCLLLVIGPRENVYFKASRKIRDLKKKGLI